MLVLGYVHVSAVFLWGHKRVLNSLELKLQIVCNCLEWLLRTELQSSIKEHMLLMTEQLSGFFCSL